MNHKEIQAINASLINTVVNGWLIKGEYRDKKNTYFSLECTLCKDPFRARPSWIRANKFHNECNCLPINSVYGKWKVLSVNPRGSGRRYKSECVDCKKEQGFNRSQLIRGDLGCGNCTRIHLANTSYERSITAKYKEYKKSAIARNYSFNISEELFESLIIGKCLYCHLEAIPKENSDPIKNESLKWEGFIGVDRINNDLGYEIDNVASCCKDCNWAKSALGLERFLDWLTRIALYNDPFSKPSIEILDEDFDWMVDR